MPFDIQNSVPSITDSLKPKFVTDEPCEEQDPPNLATRFGGAPPQEPASQSMPTGLTELLEEFEEVTLELGEAQEQAADSSNARSRGEERDALEAWIDFSEGYEENASEALGRGGGE